MRGNGRDLYMVKDKQAGPPTILTILIVWMEKISSLKHSRTNQTEVLISVELLIETMSCHKENLRVIGLTSAF